MAVLPVGVTTGKYCKEKHVCVKSRTSKALLSQRWADGGGFEGWGEHVNGWCGLALTRVHSQSPSLVSYWAVVSHCFTLTSDPKQGRLMSWRNMQLLLMVLKFHPLKLEMKVKGIRWTGEMRELAWAACAVGNWSLCAVPAIGTDRQGCVKSNQTWYVHMVHTYGTKHREEKTTGQITEWNLEWQKAKRKARAADERKAVREGET